MRNNSWTFFFPNWKICTDNVVKVNFLLYKIVWFFSDKIVDFSILLIYVYIHILMDSQKFTNLSIFDTICFLAFNWDIKSSKAGCKIYTVHGEGTMPQSWLALVFAFEKPEFQLQRWIIHWSTNWVRWRAIEYLHHENQHQKIRADKL